MITDLQKKINELQAELKKATVAFEKEMAELSKLNPAQQLATILHEKFCHWDHVDQCAWYYHKHDWKEETHGRYLSKAEALLEIEPNVEHLFKIISCL